MGSKKEQLTPKQQIFIEKYIQLGMNGTRAYMATYEKASYETAMVEASRLLRNPKIAAYLDARIASEKTTTNKLIKLQEDIANGDIAELLEITSLGGSLDLKTAKERGLTKLIKKFKQKTTTYLAKSDDGEDREEHTIELELYPADTAQVNLLKMAGKFVDKVDLTTGGKVIRVTVAKDE